ncbi:hypothetical protein DFP72DRAFT_1068180 [Ephemerocybe angulata]|uniref:Uncharacterized protein n=1 Tax=Ephemerocybe angulata TaxID=980116 RepID=A0A8H6HZ02_9AGAR|nr:hypothetical protein DFP72DRAFT_1068180 [Tulosesus angulatus]
MRQILSQAFPPPRASEGEVNESDATIPEDNDYESSGRSSSTTDSGAEDIEGSAAGLGSGSPGQATRLVREGNDAALIGDEEEGEEEGGRGRQQSKGKSKRKGKGKGKGKKKGKGKGKGRGPRSEDEDGEDEGPRPDKGKGRAPRSEGQRARSSKSQPSPAAPRGVRPLTAEDRAELEALQAMVVSMGERMGRTPRAVLEEAGFRIALARENNPFNIFEQWLVIQPSTPSLSRAEFVQYAAEQYRELPREDIPDLCELWQMELLRHQEERAAPGPGEGSRGAVREMEQIGRQLEDLCRRLKLTTDVDLRLLSSESLRTLVDNQEVYVRDLIERFTTAMQTLDLGMVDPERINLQGLFGGATPAASTNNAASGSSAQPATPSNNEAPPPPYSSQVRPAAGRAGTRPAGGRASGRSSASGVDLRTLRSSFPKGAFWARKHGESNKDHQRRVVRFMFQVLFAELVDEVTFQTSGSESLLSASSIDPAFDIGRLDLSFVSDLYDAWCEVPDAAIVPPSFDFWAIEYSELDENDPDYMDVPLVMGVGDFGEDVPLVRVRDCGSVVRHVGNRRGAAQDGGEAVPPLERARTRVAVADEFVDQVQSGLNPTPLPGVANATRSIGAIRAAHRRPPTAEAARAPVPEFVQGSSGRSAAAPNAAESLGIALAELNRPPPSRPATAASGAPVGNTGAGGRAARMTTGGRERRAREAAAEQRARGATAGGPERQVPPHAPPPAGAHGEGRRRSLSRSGYRRSHSRRPHSPLRSRSLSLSFPWTHWTHSSLSLGVSLPCSLASL